MELARVETFATETVAFVRAHTTDGDVGLGQVAPYNADITAEVFHRQVAPHALGREVEDFGALADETIEAEYKFPWSYVCRATTGLETALWDLRGKRQGEPVVSLLGGEPTSLPVYGSSMQRDIEPEREAERLARFRDERGVEAFKIRTGASDARGSDAESWPGRTAELVPAVRDAVGDDVDLFIDGNSSYTPGRAVEIGKEILAPNDVSLFEEPCPYWELEWTAEVNDALDDVAVVGGEQDTDLAQWRRMIDMGAVEIVQPDICYVGGIDRARRVAEMAADAGLPCMPHSANHSMVTVFTLHLLAALDSPGPYVEYSVEDHWAEGLLSPELTVEDGEITVPSGPGWGVEVDPDWFDRAEYRVSEV
jgi:L-alanine-DL-glutamate epimerase-like enolase superfamily enzyme